MTAEKSAMQKLYEDAVYAHYINKGFSHDRARSLALHIIRNEVE